MLSPPWVPLPVAAPRDADDEVAGRLDGVRKEPAAEFDVEVALALALAGGGGVTGIVMDGRDAAAVLVVGARTAAGVETATAAAAVVVVAAVTGAFTAAAATGGGDDLGAGEATDVVRPTDVSYGCSCSLTGKDAVATEVVAAAAVGLADAARFGAVVVVVGLVDGTRPCGGSCVCKCMCECRAPASACEAAAAAAAARKAAAAAATDVAPTAPGGADDLTTSNGLRSAVRGRALAAAAAAASNCCCWCCETMSSGDTQSCATTADEAAIGEKSCC